MNAVNSSAKFSVLAPMDGQLVPPDQVPDEVFSQKVLGDGLAIIPAGGKIYSPVDGEISSVAETKHAYGFTSEDGLEILVHFGLETVGLKGQGFTPHVKEGDKVKAGDLVAEVDMELLKSNGLNAITPVLVCDGADGMTLEAASGAVKKGTPVITLTASAVPEASPAEPAKLFQMAGAGLGFLITMGSTMENIGWAIINNLHILFAAAIGGSWAKERAEPPRPSSHSF